MPDHDRNRHSGENPSGLSDMQYRALLEFLPVPVFVFHMDQSVSYLNPAFEQVFGWTLGEVKGKRIPFVPEECKADTRKGIEKLIRERELHGFETRRLTKDGRLRDIVIDGAIFLDDRGRAAGQVITLRDVTRQKRAQRNNQALFRVAKALHQYSRLDTLLEFITAEVRSIMAVDGASVILLDEEREEFFFPVAAYEDSKTGRKFREVRFPADKGVAGQVYRTGKPLIVPDTAKSPYFYQHVDERTQYRTRNMLDVPMRIQDRMIGVLCTVNKKQGAFDQEDVELLGTVANMVALPIENARIHTELRQSHERLEQLNSTKDRVIHHFSHELKTPVSVLAASLSLLEKRLSARTLNACETILERARRNLNRLLEMEYQIEDILQGRNDTDRLK